MEVRENTVYQQLHKLSGLKSEEALDQLLSAIWQSRKTGLRDKSHFQALLNLPSLSDLDPVLVCLRSLIRKCAYDSEFTGDQLVKLLPLDLPLDLQQSLLLLFQKYHNLWKEDVSREQCSLPRATTSFHVRTSAAPNLASFPSSGLLWPRHDDSNPISRLDQNKVLSSMPIAPQSDFCPPENLGILPCLKSMTWTTENCGSEPTTKVAVITLKLLDNSKSPADETEVKFQLTRDTLEAMLRSLTYINDQLSGTVVSEPIQKKQKQFESSA